MMKLTQKQAATLALLLTFAPLSTLDAVVLARVDVDFPKVVSHRQRMRALGGSFFPQDSTLEIVSTILTTGGSDPVAEGIDPQTVDVALKDARGGAFGRITALMWPVAQAYVSQYLMPS